MSSLWKVIKFRSNFIRMHKPMRVAREQWGTVGLNSTRITLTPFGVVSSTYTQSS